jgi:hypothetical protein
MERKFGVPMTTGYFTFTMEAPSSESADESVNEAYSLVHSGTPIYGSFGMPGCPVHSPAHVRLNPDHVVGVVVIPPRNL